jgi:hypothetical protein
MMDSKSPTYTNGQQSGQNVPAVRDSLGRGRLPAMAEGLHALKHCCAVTDSASEQPATAETS